MSDLHPSLLPNGLQDLLAPQAEDEANIINGCMAVFSSFGYNRVKPPLVEFEECLLGAGPGETLGSQTFRMMDPVSGRMLGVRADTTAQIARIAGSRLGEEPRPLRLSYAADILRVKASQLRPARQFCQVGCELIGGLSVKDDVEIMLIALKSLSDCGIKNLSIDLTIPSLVDALFEKEKLNEQQQAVLNALLQKRDRDGLVENGHKAAHYLVDLLDVSGLASEAIPALKKLNLPRAAKENVSKLSDVYAELIEALAAYELTDIGLTIDLIERRGFEYKKGVSFTIFSKDVRGELGRGGRYTIQYKDKASQEQSATGFSLYMDSIMQAYTSEEAQEFQVASNDESWESIKTMQEQGLKVIRS